MSFNNIHLIHDSSQSSLSLSCLIRNCRWCSLPVLVWREMYVVLRDWCMEYIKDTVVNDWAMMMMEYKNISKNESLQSLKWNIFALHFQRLVGPLFFFFFFSPTYRPTVEWLSPVLLWSHLLAYLWRVVCMFSITVSHLIHILYMHRKIQHRHQKIVSCSNHNKMFHM